ncbi:MAG: nucleoside-diphosphate kinase, partial [cyanobacterium endosymbiont of Rhopalodia yunnanensis]
FTLIGLKLVQVSKELAEEHYDVHKERPFFSSLVEFICSSPVVAMVWQGKGVITSARTVIGATNPLTAAPGTIRGDYGISIERNLIHGSDAIETAQKEISLWFNKKELGSWELTVTPWLYE